MYDQVTLGLNVDPFILSALKEDITSEDVSTNSVMPHPQAGEVDLICKQDGIICGLQVFERVFTLLDADTKVEFYVKDGDRVENKQLIGKVYGDIRVLLCGERTALNYLQRMSGIATYTSQVTTFLEAQASGFWIPERQLQTIEFLKNTRSESAVETTTDTISRMECFLRITTSEQLAA